MIDSEFKAFLIEVNTNQCLEITSKFLESIIPQVIDNTFRYLFRRIAIDPLFNDVKLNRYPNNEIFTKLMYSLIFDGNDLN